jgi:hypothetical protein
MSTERATRILFEPHDPARDLPVAPPRLTAHDLIVRAEAGPEPMPAGRPRHPAPVRRLALSAGAVAVAVAAAVALHTFAAAPNPSIVEGPSIGGPNGNPTDVVLVPIAYEYNADAPAAGAQLRALADHLVDAPLDGHTGRYTFHHSRVTGDPRMTSPDGHSVAFADDTKSWIAADGPGRQVMTELGRDYPDQASRDYWTPRLPATTFPGAPQVTNLPPEPRAPLPTDPAQLRARLGDNPRDVIGNISHLYQLYAIPRATRADILRILADQPQLLWRGTVTDRAGRGGVAVTFDDPVEHDQNLFVFDPHTGELLADELLDTGPERIISAYILFLSTDLTDQLG